MLGAWLALRRDLFFMSLAAWLCDHASDDILDYIVARGQLEQENRQDLDTMNRLGVE